MTTRTIAINCFIGKVIVLLVVMVTCDKWLLLLFVWAQLFEGVVHGGGCCLTVYAAVLFVYFAMQLCFGAIVGSLL